MAFVRQQSADTGQAGVEAWHGSAWDGAPEFTGQYNVGNASMAENPAFEQEAQAFERNLGAAAFEHPNAKAAADAACQQALAYMDTRGSFADMLGSAGDTLEHLVAHCGSDGDVKPWFDPKSIAGNVSDAPDTVRKAMTGGNVRERLTAWHHFVEHIVLPDAVRPAEQFDVLKEIMEEAGYKMDELESFRSSQLAAGKGADDFDKYASPIYDESDRQLDDGSTVTNQVANLGTMRGSRKDITGQSSTTTSMTVGESSTGISEREAEFMGIAGPNGEIDPNAALTWSEGALSHIMNEAHPWVQAQRELSMPLKAGPSGHTNAFMNASRVLGVGVPADDMRLACLGYLLPINAHSMIEVLEAAKPHGASPYPADNTVYAHVLPLSEGELRACGKDGRFPHEAPPEATGAGSPAASSGPPTTTPPTT